MPLLLYALAGAKLYMMTPTKYTFLNRSVSGAHGLHVVQSGRTAIDTVPWTASDVDCDVGVSTLTASGSRLSHGELVYAGGKSSHTANPTQSTAKRCLQGI